MQAPAIEELISLSNDVDRALVELGLKSIIEGRFSGRYSAGQFSEAVKAAFRADLAVDADPYWMMSDDPSVRPQAKLTSAGKEYARHIGMLVKCIDHKDNGGACGQETLSAQEGGTERCSNCTSSLNHFGPVPTDVEGIRHDPPLCGMCAVSVKRRTDPTFVLPRRDTSWPPQSHRDYFKR